MIYATSVLMLLYVSSYNYLYFWMRILILFWKQRLTLKRELTYSKHSNLQLHVGVASHPTGALLKSMELA